jgi:hypothetical protein
MLAPRRSLASYFDDPGASWHDMTEAPSMKAWAAGDGGTLYFYPDGADPSNPPAGKEWHRYGKPWKPNEWGYKQEVVDAAKDKRKKENDKREAISKVVRSEHALALKAFMNHGGWLPAIFDKYSSQNHPAYVVQILAELESELSKIKAHTKTERDRIKAEHEKLVKTSENTRAKNESLYKLTYFMQPSILQNTLRIISDYMHEAPVTFDMVQMLPANNGGTFYCTVLTTYLYALKHEILEATVHKLQGRKAEAGVAEFLAHSHKAQEELAKLLKKRKAHSIPTWRPDHDPLTQLRDYLGTRQLAKHVYLHGSGNIPAHLKRYQEGYERPQPPAKSNLTDAQKHAKQVQKKAERAAKKAAKAAKKAAEGGPPGGPPATGPGQQPGKRKGKGGKGKGKPGYMEPNPSTAPTNFVTVIPDDQARTYSTRRPIFYQ